MSIAPAEPCGQVTIVSKTPRRTENHVHLRLESGDWPDALKLFEIADDAGAPYGGFIKEMPAYNEKTVVIFTD